jgi:phosphoribosylformimino-5-aminoimidazole carboxamide ribotide isomerase
MQSVPEMNLPMQIIPVLDLLGGSVVCGIGGRRSEYRPIESGLAAGSQPATIAAAFVAHFGATTCYVADLDAIERGELQVAAWKAISDAGLRILLDAGIGDAIGAEHVRKQCDGECIAADLIVGLESLASVEPLRFVVQTLGPEQVLFSLDLKAGVPLARADELRDRSPLELAEMAVAAGVRRLIVLDLADVGTGGGTRTLALCRALHHRWPQIELTAGGGVRDLDDLRQLAAAGCRAALVASALHGGRLTKADWDAALAF